MDKFIGCLHLGDERLVSKMRGFTDIECYHNNLVTEWNRAVHPDDTVYILGDISMETPNHYHILSKLKGKKYVILGNHDRIEDVPYLLQYVEGVSGMLLYEGYWLTHAPLHPQELVHTKGNIHAHIHHMKVPDLSVGFNYWGKEGIVICGEDKGYYNVDAHKLGYAPITLAALVGDKYTNTRTVFKRHYGSGFTVEV